MELNGCLELQTTPSTGPLLFYRSYDVPNRNGHGQQWQTRLHRQWLLLLPLVLEQGLQALYQALQGSQASYP